MWASRGNIFTWSNKRERGWMVRLEKGWVEHWSALSGGRLSKKMQVATVIALDSG